MAAPTPKAVAEGGTDRPDGNARQSDSRTQQDKNESDGRGHDSARRYGAPANGGGSGFFFGVGDRIANDYIDHGSTPP